MITRKSGKNSTGRLREGAAILARVPVLDTTLVKPRLAVFASAHRSYAEAQRQLEAATAQLRQAQAQLTLRDTDQDAAVEQLARALVASGEPRSNPFATFGAASPSVVKQQPAAAEAKAIHQLVAAVQRKKGVGKAAIQAAEAADQAALRVEAALQALDKLNNTIDHARSARNGLGHTWDTTLAALKRGARAAADDGAPGLYTALFGRPIRSNKKTTAPAATALAPTGPAPTAPAANAV